jgi:hypothetical protein
LERKKRQCRSVWSAISGTPRKARVADRGVRGQRRGGGTAAGSDGGLGGSGRVHACAVGEAREALRGSSGLVGQWRGTGGASRGKRTRPPPRFSRENV